MKAKASEDGRISHLKGKADFHVYKKLSIVPSSLLKTYFLKATVSH